MRAKARPSWVWTRAAVLGLAAGLVILITGDGVRSASNPGIDPLDLLNQEVKPNLLILFDTSGSMSFTSTSVPGFVQTGVGGDDPKSRMAQAKIALDDVIQANQTKINFGMLTYNVKNLDKPLNQTLQFINGTATTSPGGFGRNDGPFLYVSKDAGADLFYFRNADGDGNTFETGGPVTGSGLGRGDLHVCSTTTTTPQFAGFFCDMANSVGNYNENPATGTAATLALDGDGDTQSASREIYRSFSNRGAYSLPFPSGLTWDMSGTGTLASIPGAAPAACPEGVSPGDPTCSYRKPVCTPGTDCRYYIQSRVYRNGKLYKWRVDVNDYNARLFSITDIVGGCPLPPAGLLGRNADTNGDGNPDAVPCFQLQAVTGAAGTAVGAPATFFYTSSIFQSTVGSCVGSAKMADVAPCNQPVPAPVFDALRPELPIQPGGTLTDLAPNGNPAPNRLDGSVNPAVPGGSPNPPGLGNAGVRSAGAKPISKSLQDIRTAAPPFYPPPPGGLPPGTIQKNFVLVLTDGDDTCADANGNGDTTDDSASANAAVVANQANQLYYNGCNPANGACGTASNPSSIPQNQAEVLVVAFTASVSAGNANRIAKAGSGGTSADSFATVTCPANVPCRNAFFADSLAELRRALQQAISLVASQGEFSDQQSITESIYEIVSRVPVESPANSDTFSFPFDPLDPNDRYASTVPVLLQSTFEMPEFKGHLKAFRNRADPDSPINGTPQPPGDANPPPSCVAPETAVGPDTCELWDAAVKLCQRVTGTANCQAAAGTPLGDGTATFANLHGTCSPGTIDCNDALIQRRIFTTSQAGVNPNHTPQNLVDRAASVAWTRLALWPPDTSNSGVAPDAASDPDGSLDDPLGITYPTLPDDLARFNQLKADFGACVGSNLPGDCSAMNDTFKFRQAKREAREMILAYIAGAKFVKDASGNPTRSAGNILYRARSWILAESTLGAPAVVAPPVPQATTQHLAEYNVYRDSPKGGAGPVDFLENGFGLRNPDDANFPASVSNVNLKPVMTVVYHPTNEALHAFRAGPCPSSVAACGGETGGEELWAFVPFDELGKLRTRLLVAQGRTNHTFMLAGPIRFNDVFVSGSFSKTKSGVTVSGGGVWRVVAIFGRGAGGKHLTALDVTTPGPFTRKSLVTDPPIVVWNRGNPDTNDAKAKTASNSFNNSSSDYNAYLKMGETWSVPAMTFVKAASNTTARKPGGVEFASYLGSGYTDVAAEGKTFYALDTVTGDVIASHDIPNGSSAAGIANALVASPSAYAEFPFTVAFRVNPTNIATEKTTEVYFPDLHSRIWRFVTDNPGTAPSLFKDVTADGDQPVANGVTLAGLDSDGTVKKPHLFLEAGNDSRVPPPPASPFFRMYGFRDSAGTADALFALDFPQGFRGTVQPAAAFNCTDPPVCSQGFLRVFFAGTRFNPAVNSCVSSFDSVIFALLGVSGGAAYDLNAAGDDSSVTMTGQKVQALQTVRGKLVVDTGLGAQNAPPPPKPPLQPPGSASPIQNIGVGAPSVPGTIPYKLGTTVCR